MSPLLSPAVELESEAANVTLAARGELTLTRNLGSKYNQLPLGDTPAPAVGDSAGPYELTAEIGRGGYSMVFRGDHRWLPRTAAIKVLTTRDGRLAADTGLLRREGRILSRLKDPHFVRVLDYSEAGPFCWLAVEYVTGTSLAERIRQEGAWKPEHAVPVLAEIVAAMDVFAGSGFVHNDLKPGNILIDKHGSVRLIDLGLAHPAGETGGRFAGTITHMAPEVLLERAEPSEASDVFSFGVIAYELLTGRLPIEADRAEEIIRHYRRRPMPAVTGVPSWLAHLVEECLAKCPEARPTFAQLAERMK